MKSLTLADGTVLQFTDTSTVYSLIGVYANYAELDSIRPHFTKENLLTCTFGDETYHQLVPVGVSASSDMEGNVTATFSTREMTDLEKIQEEQAEQNDAINFLLME